MPVLITLGSKLYDQQIAALKAHNEALEAQRGLRSSGGRCMLRSVVSLGEAVAGKNVYFDYNEHPTRLYMTYTFLRKFLGAGFAQNGVDVLPSFPPECLYWGAE